MLLGYLRLHELLTIGDGSPHKRQRHVHHNDAAPRSERWEFPIGVDLLLGGQFDADGAHMTVEEIKADTIAKIAAINTRQTGISTQEVMDRQWRVVEVYDAAVGELIKLGEVVGGDIIRELHAVMRAAMVTEEKRSTPFPIPGD